MRLIVFLLLWLLLVAGKGLLALLVANRDMGVEKLGAGDDGVLAGDTCCCCCCGGGVACTDCTPANAIGVF